MKEEIGSHQASSYADTCSDNLILQSKHSNNFMQDLFLYQNLISSIRVLYFICCKIIFHSLSSNSCISLLIIIQSTMSILAQQLNKLKANNSLKIAPGAPLPHFILDKNTARNTTIDVLYTMAIMGFGELKKQLLGAGKRLGEDLLSESYKQINRNKLTQQQNNNLSAKTTKFLLMISPFFLNRCCQTIIEYLIRNFRIHSFEPEQLVLIFLQYWQHPLYADLIGNIESKNPVLGFIDKMKEKKQLNFVYILKSLTYSRNLLENLIMLNRQYIKEESMLDQEIEIDLMTQKTMISKVAYKESNLTKFSCKQFLVRVLQGIITSNMTGFTKDICQFCLFTAKENDAETRSMCMLLIISLMSNSEVADAWINRCLKYLLSYDLTDNLFNFMMVLSQRWPLHLTKQIISLFISKQGFLHNISNFRGSKFMIFYLSYRHYLEETNKQIKGLLAQSLELMVLDIKQQQFVQSHQIAFYSSIFQMTLEVENNSGDKKKQKFLTTFIKKNLLYEYAVFLDQNKTIKVDTLLTGSIPINQDGSVDFSEIHKKKKQVNKKMLIRKPEQRKDDLEQQSGGQQTTRKKSIIQVVNAILGTHFTKLQPANAEQRQHLELLFKDYYDPSKQCMLSVQQKNRLFDFEFIFSLYTSQFFMADIKNKDYLTPIKFVMKTDNPQFCFTVLESLVTVEPDNQSKSEYAKQQLNNIMFRELCRQAISKLANIAQSSYNRVVIPLGAFYHKLFKITVPEIAQIMNEFLLKISQGIFKVTGNKKGKFYKILAVHAKLLAYLNQSNLQRPQEIREVFQRLIDIFGYENMYCYLIGCIDQIGSKESSNKKIYRMINQVVMSAGEESNIFQTMFQILVAAQKLTVFCYIMIKQENQEESQDVSRLIKQFGVSIAKKMAISFFGIQKSKGIKKIAKKILVFLTLLFKSDKFQLLFKETLTDLSRKQEIKISSRCTNVYKLLTSIQSICQGPLKQISVDVKSKIIQLFPLELRIQVLGPLLPSEDIYNNLGQQLQVHSHKKFDSLKKFVDILPQNLTDNYLKFITECMNRRYLPSTQTCQQILSDVYLKEGSLAQIQFISSFTQNGAEESLDLLNDFFKVVLRDCQQPNQYSLAISYRLISNLKQYADPYIDQLFGIGIQVNSQHSRSFINQVVQVFTESTILSILKRHYKKVNHIQNFTYFFKKVAEKVSFQSLFKIYHSYSARAINMKIVEEQEYGKICDELAEVFVQMTMKMNENDLRKNIINLVRFGSETTKEDKNYGLLFNSRKNLVMIIYRNLTERLGELFIHFYGYIFEETVKDLAQLSAFQSVEKIKKQKRAREHSEFAIKSAITYLKNILHALNNLFTYDSQNEFMDSMKFDSLAPNLAAVFSITRFNQSYATLMSQSLNPCLISLYKNTIDDYKLKTFNTEVLRMIKKKENKINLAIFDFIDKVIDQLDHRFLLFTDELTPILIEFSQTRSTAIKKSVQSIIYKIQNISGSRIENFIR